MSNKENDYYLRGKDYSQLYQPIDKVRKDTVYQVNKHQAADHTPKSYDASFSAFISSYLKIRFRQLRISIDLFSKLVVMLVLDIKSTIVRNMYWGRTSFYKTAFHTVVICITLLAFSTGLSARLLVPQRDQIDNISASRQQLDSDLVSQQGAFFPVSELNGDTDSLYGDYVVQEGDSLAKIADENSISQDTIRWANNIPAGRDTLSVGQTLRIPRINGVLYVVKEGDTVDKILSRLQLQDRDANRFDFLELNTRAGYIGEDDSLRVGSTVFIPDATLPAPRPVVSRPTPTVVTGGGGVNVPSGVFVNPMQASGGYRLSRGYARWHTGVDLGVNSGSWIVAAGSGTVARAGVCTGGLGYCVVIKHAGGLSTLYAHGNGVMAVRAGQAVQAGQQIMQSGCSGNCYGPHLHLSLAANNNDVYSCYTCRINPAGRIPY